MISAIRRLVVIDHNTHCYTHPNNYCTNTFHQLWKPKRSIRFTPPLSNNDHNDHRDQPQCPSWKSTVYTASSDTIVPFYRSLILILLFPAIPSSPPPTTLAFAPTISTYRHHHHHRRTPSPPPPPRPFRFLSQRRCFSEGPVPVPVFEQRQSDHRRSRRRHRLQVKGRRQLSDDWSNVGEASVDSLEDEEDEDELVRRIRQGYESNQTDGILSLAPFLISSPVAHDSDAAAADDNNDGRRGGYYRFSTSEIISATLRAVYPNGGAGAVASVLNAMMALLSYPTPSLSSSSPSSSLHHHDDNNNKETTRIHRVHELLTAYNQLESTHGITPDIVTYCLAYRALAADHTDDDDGDDTSTAAGAVLDQALRQSKKRAGGIRRRIVAASVRRVKSKTCRGVEDRLGDLLLLGGDGGDGDDDEDGDGAVSSSDSIVLAETDDYVVLNKPSGVSCYHNQKLNTGKKIKKKNNKKKKGRTTATATKTKPIDLSLEDALIAINLQPISTLNPDCLGLVHRLDRGTSGCIVLAKNEGMHARLVSEFFTRRIEKRYWVLVAPAPPPPSPMEGEAEAEGEGWGYINVPVHGRPARSKYRVLERYSSSSSSSSSSPSSNNISAALLEFQIFTGRKHQVRVHAALGLGCPVLLDGRYTSLVSQRENEEKVEAVNRLVGRELERGLGGGGRERFFLHAASLSIPEYGIDVMAPMPFWWNDTISLLRGI